ncbi:MAG: PspC domain-containing protein [Propionibacteriaceae bacterium]|nr:PspC domain-containing protein [Propionibacteriaceae bacterium]
MNNRQLTRSKSNRVFAGVAAGIANYLQADLATVRLITAAVVFVVPGFGIMAYVLAWIILPEEGSSTTGLDTIMTSLRNHQDRGGDPHPGDLR